MTTITYNRYKYDFLNDFSKNLERAAKEADESAEETLKYCTDEESGSVDKSHWRYQEYLNYKDRAEAARKLIKELEKI